VKLVRLVGFITKKLVMLCLTMLTVAQATRISSSAGTFNECRNEINAQRGHVLLKVPSRQKKNVEFD